MKLKKLMEHHIAGTSSASIEKNWGDGYLLQHNRIFKNIRNETLACGYQFDSSIGHDFLVFPFSQLEDILSSHKIPYLNNVDVLKSLLIKTKDQVEWEEITDGFRRNYLFHESCHAVARNINDKYFEKNEKLIQVILEESFANTCELMAVMDAENSVHQLFYELNSYTFLFEAKAYLKKTSQDIGEVTLFQLLTICYFYANVLKEDLNQKELDLILKAVAPGAIDRKNLKKLCQIPFTLDLRFRTLTTGLYLKLTGLRMDRNRLQQVVTPDSRLISYTKHLAQLALQK